MILPLFDLMRIQPRTALTSLHYANLNLVYKLVTLYSLMQNLPTFRPVTLKYYRENILYLQIRCF